MALNNTIKWSMGIMMLFKAIIYEGAPQNNVAINGVIRMFSMAMTIDLLAIAVATSRRDAIPVDMWGYLLLICLYRHTIGI